MAAHIMNIQTDMMDSAMSDVFTHILIIVHKAQGVELFKGHRPADAI
jgi:hypothetical protein